MALYAFQKVICVDPCDPNQIQTRSLALLVQVAPAPTNPKTSISRPVEGWKPEPILVNPARMVDKIEGNSVIQKIHVIDPVFGNQIVRYITDEEPVVRFNASHDKKEIAALWPRAIRVPTYSGHAQASLPYKSGEIYMDGARTHFSASYNDKYPATEEVPADDVPTYCHCNLKGTDYSGRLMVQCSNGERYCLREWYHIECIGMADEDVPPGDWFCEECVEGRLGWLRDPDYTYIPWAPTNQKAGKNWKHNVPRSGWKPHSGRTANKQAVEEDLGAEVMASSRDVRAAARAVVNKKELEKYELQFRDAILLSEATGGSVLGRKRAASL